MLTELALCALLCTAGSVQSVQGLTHNWYICTNLLQYYYASELTSSIMCFTLPVILFRYVGVPLFYSLWYSLFSNEVVRCYNQPAFY